MNRIQRIPDGTALYYESPDAETTTRHDGEIEIFPSWVRFGGPVACWIPRERVEQIHES
jgi:hypothetical protein